MNTTPKTEAQASIIESIKSIIESMTATVERMQRSLDAPVLRGENTLIVTEDSLNAVVITDDQFRLGSIEQGAFFTPSSAAKVVAAWNEQNPQMPVVVKNWTDAYRNEVTRTAGYLEILNNRLAELQ